jgi:biopolymer transport protein ExbB
MGDAGRVWAVFQQGGAVMWPLLALSLVSIALCVERAIFWLRTHTAAPRRRAAAAAACIRRRDFAGARALAGADSTVYGWFIGELLSGDGPTEAAARALLEDARIPLERFSVLLSTIITAAPMLGILGTVTGIIESFGLLGGRDVLSDPSMVAGGIAQALYTTVFGLVVALLTLFPYAIYRAQADRALSRLEAIASAAIEAPRPVTPAAPPAT